MCSTLIPNSPTDRTQSHKKAILEKGNALVVWTEVEPDDTPFFESLFQGIGFTILLHPQNCGLFRVRIFCRREELKRIFVGPLTDNVIVRLIFFGCHRFISAGKRT